MCASVRYHPIVQMVCQRSPVRSNMLLKAMSNTTLYFQFKAFSGVAASSVQKWTLAQVLVSSFVTGSSYPKRRIRRCCSQDSRRRLPPQRYLARVNTPHSLPVDSPLVITGKQLSCSALTQIPDLWRLDGPQVRCADGLCRSSQCTATKFPQMETPPTKRTSHSKV